MNNKKHIFVNPVRDYRSVEKNNTPIPLHSVRNAPETKHEILKDFNLEYDEKYIFKSIEA